MFGAALLRFQEPLHALVLRRIGRQDAADVVQETYLRVLSSPKRPAPGELSTAWLWAFARNVLRERRRKLVDRAYVQPLEHLEQAVSQEDLTSQGANPTDLLDSTEPLLAVLRHLHGLSPAERDLVEEYYLRRRSVKRLAAELRKSQKATRSRLDRAMARLRHKALRCTGTDPGT